MQLLYCLYPEYVTGISGPSYLSAFIKGSDKNVIVTFNTT